MRMDKLKSWSVMAPALAGAAAFILALGLMLRPLWFDEALTVMEFMSHPFSRIYFAYDIPNNHILFTMTLKLWASFQNLFCPVPEFSFRLPSLLFGAAAAALVCRLSFRQTGRDASVLCAILLASSCAFTVFATAIRGYMMSLLLCVLALNAANAWRRKGGAIPGAAHFAFCLLAVGTVPTNLLALEAIPLLYAPDILSGRKKALKLAWLAAAPLLGLTIFYLPIAPKFIHSLSLGEGWGSSVAAAWNLYGSFLASFLPLLPFCAIGAWRMWRSFPRLRLRMLSWLAIFALPLPPLFLLSPSPFPRVFFPLWGVWAIVLACALSAYLKSGNGRSFKRAALPVLLVCAWIPLEFHGRGAVSAFLFRGGEDDLTCPRYMSPAFKPYKVTEFMRRRLDEGPAKAFASFDSDPYSLILYGKYMKVPEEAWLFDSPRKRPFAAFDPASKSFIVCVGEEERKALERRFNAKSSAPVLDAGVQKVYELFFLQAIPQGKP